MDGRAVACENIGENQGFGGESFDSSINHFASARYSLRWALAEMVVIKTRQDTVSREAVTIERSSIPAAGNRFTTTWLKPNHFVLVVPKPSQVSVGCGDECSISNVK